MIKARKSVVIDEGQIRRQTDWSKGYMRDYRERFEKFDKDADAEHRRARRQCPACYYIRGSIGGQAVTESDCGVCRDVIQNGSTAVDIVCRPCSDKHGLCARCGGDIEAVARRKGWGL